MRPWTDTQTRVTTIHFALSTTHAKCNLTWRLVLAYNGTELQPFNSRENNTVNSSVINNRRVGLIDLEAIRSE